MKFVDDDDDELLAVYVRACLGLSYKYCCTVFLLFVLFRFVS